MKNYYGLCIIGLVVCLFISFKTNKTDSFKSYNQYHEDIWYLNVHKQKGNKIDLFVKEVGIGDTIVVVHGGFGAEHSYLIDLLKPLYNKFHFVFYDQRGSLRSPVKNDSLITAMSHIDDLELLRKELKINKLNLLGHSMGTWVSSAYLDKYPQNVNSMVLMGLVWPKPNMNEEESKINAESEEAFSAFLKRPSVTDIIKKEGFDSITNSSKINTYKWRIKFASASIYNIEKWRQMKGGWVFYNQKSGTAAGTTMPEEYNWIETYKTNPEVSITVINGTHDFVDFGGKLQGQWLNPLENVNYHVIENAGHNAWIDEPEQVKQIIIHNFKK